MQPQPLIVGTRKGQNLTKGSTFRHAYWVPVDLHANQVHGSRPSHHNTRANILDKRAYPETTKSAQVEQPELVSSQMMTTIDTKRSRRKKPGSVTKRRPCRKCRGAKCEGREVVDRCKKPCRDCNQVNCKGRNPEKPSCIKAMLGGVETYCLC
jgi:hypothetical protein